MSLLDGSLGLMEATAEHDFNANADDELSFRRGQVLKLSTNRCGFVAGCTTVNAAHAVHLLLEKHREEQKLVHFAVLDLKKILDRVPREAIWYVLRRHDVLKSLLSRCASSTRLQ
ncbi:unnamed protein product [Heligmosomoides polygyrus]|uniref:SH3 domain-containing protein n=1 Tax=Heligmosomoides polygyrus TaxID=6339 RepID=A0A183F2N2_HELPZ|nr:unnamed protein product [Heligmosomoides polygyrus]